MVEEVSLFSPEELKTLLKNEEMERRSFLKNNRKLKEIIKRVFIGNYENSKNVLLLSTHQITHIIIIRFKQEDYVTRTNFPNKFEYYIIELNGKFHFSQFCHFKYLLDEILFEKEKNKIFIHSYLSKKSILCLLTFYIVTTMRYDLEDAIKYIKILNVDFQITREEADKIYYFAKRHQLTYFPGEFTTYEDIADKEKE